VASTLLVSRENEFEVFAVVDSVEDGKNGTTRVTNCECTSVPLRLTKGDSSRISLTHVLDTLPQHHFVEDLATILADEAMVQLGLAVWLQRLHIAQLRVFTVECWAGYCAGRAGGGGGGGLGLQGSLSGDIAFGGGLGLGGRSASVVGRQCGDTRGR
jgi:hypothetical protein